MPTRSSSTSVLRWPDARSVLEAARLWATEEAARHTGLLRLGLFGSYARGQSGVGSDIDLIAICRDCREPFERRALSWRTESLPVPAELLVYTEHEWAALKQEGGRFVRTIEREALWLVDSETVVPG